MADGWARVSGEFGVCTLIGGPGLTNAITPIAQAYHDSIPMLVISGAVPDRDRDLGEIHDLPDQQALMSTVTAFSHTVRDPAELPDVLARAREVFESRRPRPVHVAIPLDVLEQPVGELALSAAPPPRPARRGRRSPAPRSGSRRPVGRWCSSAAAPATPGPRRWRSRGARRADRPDDQRPRHRAARRRAVPRIGAQLRARLGIAARGRRDPAGRRRAVRSRPVGADEPLEPARPGPRRHRRRATRATLAGRDTLCGDATTTLGDLLAALAGEADETRLRGRASAGRRGPGGAAPPPEVARFAPLLDVLHRVLPADRIVAGDSTQPVYAANHLLPARSRVPG